MQQRMFRSDKVFLPPEWITAAAAANGGNNSLSLTRLGAIYHCICMPASSGKSAPMYSRFYMVAQKNEPSAMSTRNAWQSPA